ncbi:cytochrome D1 domain-containing protein [Bacillus sp. SM2101]|uniref:YncE family protein n=1 Tax=Bacillus sp. SM2101 TaxID=2805366 RepID=UPI001BDF3330|nr:cytochrome D1 domain-containing protein [Bacillus sp. SM2101]
MTTTVIDVKTHRMITTLPIGNAFFLSSVFTPDGKFAYITNRGGSTVSVIDVKTHIVIATVQVGNNPTGVTFTPDDFYSGR